MLKLIKKFINFRKKNTKYNKYYAQFAEDIVANVAFLSLFNDKISSYIEIGSNNPTQDNNTYYFYKNNSIKKGVLIEPNPKYAYTPKERPKDVFLPCGIAFNDEKEADYYDFGDIANALNTFSKERAQITEKNYPLQKIHKIKLVKIQEVLDEYFAQTGLDYFSIDVEGLEYQILKQINFEKIRPKMFCIEANKNDLSYNYQNEIINLMKSYNYALVADTFINYIFADTTQMNSILEMKFNNIELKK